MSKRKRGEAPHVLVDGHERAVVFQQPTNDGRENGCWIPPVVAFARYYGLDPAASIDSVLAVRPQDEAEDVFEMMEDIYGVWAPAKVWGNDEAFLADSAEHGVPWCGPTSEDDGCGNRSINPAWFADVCATVDAGDLVLLLVERLESGKDKGGTHYLVVLGYQETVRRRGGNTYELRVKDPMEGDQILTAVLWGKQGEELKTLQVSGSALDRYSILESTHMLGLSARLQGMAGGQLPTSAAPATAEPASQTGAGAGAGAGTGDST